MTKIRIMAVGRCRDPSIGALAATYLRRIRSYVPTDLVEMETGRDPLGRLKKSISPRDRVVALDAGGRMMDSGKFAAHLEQLLMKHDRILFVIGDAEGFPRGFDDMVAERLSLSAMTFQHDLARVVFLEQLYRAFTILRHEPYHK